MLTYDRYVVTFSSGKDSTALVLYLLSIGVPKEKIELWHHLIDSRDSDLFDWEITEGYCKAFAEAFGITLYFSWREGGLEREMLRNNTATAPVWFAVPREEWEASDKDKVYDEDTGEYLLVTGGKGPLNTRMMFPQVSADLSVRFCSAYGKIDICTTAINNQNRFRGIKTVVLSGERGEESAARAKYKVFEPDRSDLRNGKKYQRHVDRWRPIKDWTEQQVWEIIERYKVRVHPAYYLGFGRVSCRYCIFGNANQMASAYAINPVPGEKMMDYEDQFGKTIKRNISLRELVLKGVAYDMDPQLVEISKQHSYNLPIIMDEWVLPSGAYGDKCGPT